MRTLLGSLSICPLLNHIDLPHHTVEELLSISHLKVWGDTQKPHGSMAYLLIRVEDSSEGGGYGLALVWISPHQTRVSMMEEALGILSTCTSNGLDWPYVFIQLYEGANHVPLPKDKHLSVLSQGNAWRAHVGRSASLKSASSYLLGCMSHLSSGFKQLMTSQPPSTYQDHCIAVLVSTINDHLYIKIDIPSPTPVEAEPCWTHH